MAMLGAVSAFLSLVAAMIIAIRFDAKKYRKQIAPDAKRKQINEYRRKENERKRLEEENKHLRLQLGLPPHRREAVLPEPAKPKSPAASGKVRGSEVPIPIQILLMGGAAALMYSAKRRQESKSKLEDMSKAELASAYCKMRAKSQKNLRPVASMLKVNCIYCGDPFTKAESHCPSCGAPGIDGGRKEEADEKHGFIAQLHSNMKLMNKILDDVSEGKNEKES